MQNYVAYQLPSFLSPLKKSAAFIGFLPAPCTSFNSRLQSFKQTSTRFLSGKQNDLAGALQDSLMSDALSILSSVDVPVALCKLVKAPGYGLSPLMWL